MALTTDEKIEVDDNGKIIKYKGTDGDLKDLNLPGIIYETFNDEIQYDENKKPIIRVATVAIADNVCLKIELI